MSYQIGTGFIGSESIKISKQNEEVISKVILNEFHKSSLYKFNFINYDSCTVKVNNQFEFYLSEGQGFHITEIDVPITNFVINEENVRYHWIGAF